MTLASILLLLAAGPGAEGEPPIAGRFEGKIVYEVASADADVERLRRHCNEQGGTFDECGSACAPGAICASVCAFTCELDAKDEEPMSLRYVSSDLGFQLEHPAGLEITRIGDRVEGVRFTDRRADGTEAVLTVQCIEAPSGHYLTSVGNPDARPIEVGRLSGFAYDEPTDPRVRTLILGKPEGGGSWHLTYPKGDPVLERMVQSFAPAG